MASKEKTLVLTSIKTGLKKTFTFEHALALFKLEKKKGIKHSHTIKDHQFNGNDIIRNTSTGDSKKSDK